MTPRLCALVALLAGLTGALGGYMLARIVDSGPYYCIHFDREGRRT